MGELKRPKLKRGETSSGAEFYYYRKPSTARSTKPGPQAPKRLRKGPFRDRKKAKPS